VIVVVALGGVEGVVGANHQAVGALGAVPRGDPDRATVRAWHPRTKASANIGSVGFAAGRHHEREFVASDPSQHIVWAQHPGPLVGDFDQQQVSRRMPVPVVYGLEVVDIDQSNGNRLTGAPGARQCADKFSLPGPSIGQPCQRVGVGKVVKLVQKLVLCALLIADAGDQSLTLASTRLRK
jgi:hypothetical protein